MAKSGITRSHLKSPPRDEHASSFLREKVQKLVAHNVGPIADVACGYGRNAFYLARRGFEVYCLDNNERGLKRIADNQGDLTGLIPALIDLENESLPFESDFLGGAICVHSWKYPWSKRIIATIAPLIKKGGFILIQTVDNRGGNYIELPKAGYVAEQLAEGFEILTYREKNAGPDDYDSVTVKALGIRR